MKWLMNLLRGTVSVTVTGAFPERLLNLCAQQGVAFWGLQWIDDSTLVFISRRGTLSTVQQLAQRLSCTLEVDNRWGLPFFLGRFRYRYAFLVGLTISVITGMILSNFIFTIEVTGNETVSTGEILTELRRFGVTEGVYGPNLERIEIAQQALLVLDELSWMAINLHGTRIEVIVRERILPPVTKKMQGVSHIYAKTSGIVMDMQVLDGMPMVLEGDTVAEGDMLISGDVEMKPPIYSPDSPSQWLRVHASGEIFARTWRVLEMKIPLTTTTKSHTGEEKSKRWLEFLGLKVDFFGNSSISEGKYDKITDVYQWHMPSGEKLPFAFAVETTHAYTPISVSVNPEAAQALLELRLLDELTEDIGETGSIISTQYTARMDAEMLYVTLTAECREEIGITKPEEQGEPQIE